MNDFDNKLKDALSNDRPGTEFGHEQGVFEQMAGVFKSRQRWLIILDMVMIFVFLGLGVWAFLGLLEAEDFRSHVLYGLGVGFSLLAVGMLKMWFFMQINRNSVLREVVRLQIQVADLAKKLDDRA